MKWRVPTRIELLHVNPYDNELRSDDAIEWKYKEKT